jgi:hypothetical protein
MRVALAIMVYARKTVFSSREVYLASFALRNSTRKIQSWPLLQLLPPYTGLTHLLQKIQIEMSSMILQSHSPVSTMKYASKLQIVTRNMFKQWRNRRDRMNYYRSRLLSCFGSRYVVSVLFTDGITNPQPTVIYRMDHKLKSFVYAAPNIPISLLPIAPPPYAQL